MSNDNRFRACLFLLILMLFFSASSYAESADVSSNHTQFLQIVITGNTDILVYLSDPKGSKDGFWRMPRTGEFGFTEETRKYMFSLLTILYSTGKFGAVSGSPAANGDYHVIKYLHALDK